MGDGGGGGVPWIARLPGFATQFGYFQYISAFYLDVGPATGVAMAGIDQPIVVGEGARERMPVTPGAFQTTTRDGSDGWILRERHRIEHIGATVVQGRYDMVCPPVSAWKLAQGWAKCQLRMVGMAGHALSEPGISEALVQATDALRAR